MRYKRSFITGFELAEIWDSYGGENRWTRAAREFGEVGGLAVYWCGMPQNASAIPLTFSLHRPDGTELPCNYRLKDIIAATERIKAETLAAIGVAP
jgi:hypothetical protein